MNRSRNLKGNKSSEKELETVYETWKEAKLFWNILIIEILLKSNLMFVLIAWNRVLEIMEVVKSNEFHI